MNKSQLMFFLVVLALFGTIWGSVRDKQVKNLNKEVAHLQAQLSEGVTPVSDEAVAAELAARDAEITGLNKQLAALTSGEGGEVDASALVACNQRVVQLEKNLAAAQDKAARLAELEGKLAAMEGMKSKMANSVDSYSAQAQEFSAQVEKDAIHIQALEKALEGKNRAISECRTEVDRTRLNMNVLLSKIAAQEESLQRLQGGTKAQD